MSEVRSLLYFGNDDDDELQRHETQLKRLFSRMVSWVMSLLWWEVPRWW